MAVRIPLVRINGQTHELPATDKLAGVPSVTYSDNAPATPAAFDIWVDTSTGIEYVWISDGDGQWVEFGPGGPIVFEEGTA